VQYHAYDDAEPYDGVGLCRILLSSGANRDAKDNEGRTPLDYGRLCKHKHSEPLSDLLQSSNLSNLLNFEVPKKVKEPRLNITKLQAAVTKGLKQGSQTQTGWRDAWDYLLEQAAKTRGPPIAFYNKRQ
jgi:hypothetical protein